MITTTAHAPMAPDLGVAFAIIPLPRGTPRDTPVDPRTHIEYVGQLPGFGSIEETPRAAWRERADR